jgi:hypothetical protein
MNQLALFLPDTPGAPEFGSLPVLADAELAAARSFAEMEKAVATRRAYRSDFAIFAAWCHARGAEPLPASPASATCCSCYLPIRKLIASTTVDAARSVVALVPDGACDHPAAWRDTRGSGAVLIQINDRGGLSL